MDLKLRYVDENDLGVDDFSKLVSQCLGRSGCVAHAPALSHKLHLLPEETVVVFMHRDCDDVERSQHRIAWSKYGHEERERNKYRHAFFYSIEGIDTEAPISLLKHQVWALIQKPILAGRCYDLEYASMSSHRAWMDPELRVGFGPFQTCAGGTLIESALEEPKRKLPTIWWKPARS